MEADIDRLVRAIRFGLDAHGRQTRKDKVTPYMVHPMGVMRILTGRMDVRDVDVLVAALLHDVVEDTKTTADDVEWAFGPRVRELVLHVTNPEDLLHISGQRMEAKLEHILGIMRNAPMEAVAIKLADRTDNWHDTGVLMRLGVWSPEKVHLTREHSRAIFLAAYRRAQSDLAGEVAGGPHPLSKAILHVAEEELDAIRAGTQAPEDARTSPPEAASAPPG